MSHKVHYTTALEALNCRVLQTLWWSMEFEILRILHLVPLKSEI